MTRNCNKFSDTAELRLSLIVFGGLFMITCGLNIIAAMRIWRWFSVPFIILELIRLCILFMCHVVLMMIFKKQLNLGVLIAACSAGGFLLLFLAYMWSCSVSLFQIIGIVNSKEYQKIISMGSPAPAKSQKNLTVYNKQMEAEGHAGIFASDFSEFYRRPRNFKY